MEQITQTSLILDALNNRVSFQGVIGDNVTKSDTDVLEPGCLFVGTGGTLIVRLVSGSTLTFKNIANGSFLPIVVDMVFATNCTATDIIILR